MDKQQPNLCKKKDECCGCTACATICPMQAIIFDYDSEGFLYPKINYDKCIGCLKCETVCAFKKDIKYPIEENKNVEIFATKSKNKEVVKKSSSGGMFTVLSDVFLNKDDAVAACKYSYDSDSVVFSLILDKESRDEARGSKYIQAELKDFFNELLDFLREHPDKKMLVVGTGCQIAGLDLVLKEKKFRNRVVLVDLICHGAASPGLWKKYINTVEYVHGNKINYITFKNKRNGWESPSTFVVINDKEIHIKPYSDWFYMGWSLRESCYKCPYTKVDRHSDITIGDFWGIQNTIPDFYDPMGVSLVITHTENGKVLFESIKGSIDYCVSNRKDCRQPRLISPQLCPNDRKHFWNDMQQNGIDYCIKKYVENYSLSNKEKIIKILRKILRK